MLLIAPLGHPPDISAQIEMTERLGGPLRSLRFRRSKLDGIAVRKSTLVSAYAETCSGGWREVNLHRRLSRFYTVFELVPVVLGQFSDACRLSLAEPTSVLNRSEQRAGQLGNDAREPRTLEGCTRSKELLEAGLRKAKLSVGHGTESADCSAPKAGGKRRIKPIQDLPVCRVPNRLFHRSKCSAEYFDHTGSSGRLTDCLASCTSF
jgi:hypothetical protein